MQDCQKDKVERVLYLKFLLVWNSFVHLTNLGVGHLGREGGPGCHSKTTALLYIQGKHGGYRSDLKNSVDGSLPSAAFQDFTPGLKLTKECLLCSGSE